MSWEYSSYGFLNFDYISEETLCINDLGLEKRQNELYDYKNNNRDYSGYLFQYTLDGEGRYETPSESYVLSKGTAFLITFPEDSHYYLPLVKDPKHHWTYFYIHFSGPAAEPFYKRIRELKGPAFSVELNSSPILNFFALYDSLKTGNQLAKYKGSEWLYSFLISLLGHLESPPNQRLNPHVTASLDWMQTHYASPLNLETMSLELGVTLSHLSREFHKELGITPIAYLTRIRLEHAMQLLLNTDASIQKIADDCGFSSSNYFTKVYKKVLHITPAQYRKQRKL
ncbi:MAG: DNA-binding protein AraC-type [Anaerocolumna sp.]|jgi:AraC-like DNA-binding protein|nr:DNA-binding protein AraC-type [Anaerocolumna sp.]